MFLYVGIGVLGVNFAFLALYLLSIDSNLNSVWEALRTRALNGFVNIRQIISDRLNQYSFEADMKENEVDSNQYKTSVIFYFKHSWRYFFKFSALYILSAVFLIISSFVFYENIQTSMYYRSLLISTIGGRRVLTTELGFYTLESRLEGTKYELDKIFSRFSGFPDSVDGFSRIVSEIEKNLNDFRNPNLKNLLSEDLQQILYENISNSSPFLTFGTFSSLDYITDEAYNLVYNDHTSFNKSFRTFFTDFMTLNRLIRNCSIKANTDSQNIIQTQVYYLIIYVACTCSFLLFITAAVYYPFLISEIKTLRKLVEILKIIPSTRKGVNDKA